MTTLRINRDASGKAQAMSLAPPPFVYERSASRLMFVVLGKPIPWQRAGRTKSGRSYTEPKSRRYQSQVRTACMLALQLGDAPHFAFDADTSRFKVHVHAYFPDMRTRDGDRVGNNVQDALKGVLYRDDTWQRVTTTTEGRLDRENPRTAVIVEVAT